MLLLASSRIRLQTIVSAFIPLIPLLAVAQATPSAKYFFFFSFNTSVLVYKLESLQARDLCTLPVNGEEDAELMWLIDRILDVAAADSICEIHTGRFSEYKCIMAAVSMCHSLFNMIRRHESTNVEV